MVDYDNNDSFSPARRRMIEYDLIGRGIKDAAVLGAMGAVRREDFVPEKYQGQAYADNPLPIGGGQTISQPYIVALMTEGLEPVEGDRVLEIGTGCGYQTAVLSRIVGRVYTIERFNELSEAAQRNLEKAGAGNVEFCVGDGSRGWPGAGECEFDKIIVTAALPSVPVPLNEQLKEGGVLVAPVGGEFSQVLNKYFKRGGRLEAEKLCDCRFVKLVGEYGFIE